jgi:hypothetical protein
MADNGTIEVTGLEERIKKMGELSTKNPEMRKRINEVIRQTLAQVRKSLQGDARSGLQMQSDPRNAYKAVRMAVYRRLFGGQVNILQSRKAHGGRLYEPPRRGTSDPKGRGGNRALRSGRTEQLMSYQGADRGFILRFLNQGTTDRVIHQMGGHNLRTGSTSVIKTKSIGGNRGSITARNWFGPRSQAEMERAAQNLDKMIDDIITGVMY